MFDFVAVSGSLEGRMIEFVDHLHEHFVTPVEVRDGRYARRPRRARAPRCEAPRWPGTRSGPMSEASAGLALGRIGLGGANLGNIFQAMSDETAWAILEAAWDSGIRYFDTAPHYGLGLAERRLGEFLRTKPRGEFVVSTKVGRLLRPSPETSDRFDDEGQFVVPADVKRVWDFSADGVRRSLEESLERLGLDSVDVLFLHDPDESTPGSRRRSRPACPPSSACVRRGSSGPWASGRSPPTLCWPASGPGRSTCSWWPAATRCWSSRPPRS